MFNIGDLVIYSGHGICKIDNICEKTVLGITRPYYVLHPVENDRQLTISTPVNNDNVVMLNLIDKEEAIDILESFKHPGIQWIDKHNQRHYTYSDIINTGDRKEIANIVNTLMRKEIELERNEKKFYEQDRKLLNSVQDILFEEVAMSLNTSLEEINKWVVNVIKKNI